MTSLCNTLQMELDREFTFIPLDEKDYFLQCDEKTQEFLAKWGLRENIQVQQFSFNEDFAMYHKYQFAESFFKNENVIRTLKIKKGNVWTNQGSKTSEVVANQIPCTITNMKFFNKLSEPENNITYTHGNIRSKELTEIDGFWVTDNLKSMLLDKESEQYDLYQNQERQEFVFRIFQMLVLGGELNQYEDTLEPYLNVTKKIYKDLVRVEKKNDEMKISSTILQVVAKNANGEIFYPENPNIRNMAFLCIDSSSHIVKTFLVQIN